MLTPYKCGHNEGAEDQKSEEKQNKTLHGTLDGGHMTEGGLEEGAR